MNHITQWSFLICLITVISTSIEFLVPPGKFEKAMNLILGLFIIAAFLIPFASNYHEFKNIFKNNTFGSTPKSKISNENKLSESLDKQVIDSASEKVRLIISKNLKKINIHPKKIDIFMDKDEYGRIVITKCEISVASKDAYAKEKIKKEIENTLNIKTEVKENED